MLPRLTGGSAVYATEIDACCDIQASADVYICRGMRALVPTGLRFAPLTRLQRCLLKVLPFRFMLRILPRSGAAVRGVDVGAGVVDPQYPGEIFVLIINNTGDTLAVRKGDRIAQATWLMGLKVPGAVTIDRVRVGGFGSTGN